MSRPPSPQPTEGQLEILRVLWSRGPSELGAICSELRRSRAVATTTVATMLKIMEEKGLVRRAAGSRGSRWAAASSRASTSSGLLRRIVELVFDGSTKALLVHLLERQKLSPRERREIEKLLAGRKGRTEVS